MRARLFAAILAALVLLSGCAPETSGDPVTKGARGSGEVKIDAAAPELVKLKKDSGIPDCPAAQTHDGGLPARTLPCLGGGRKVDLSTLKGPLVLNFFYGTCPPCRKEMPALEKFHEKYGDRVPIYGIDSLDSVPGVAIKLAKRSGVTYPLMADLGGDLQGTALSVRGMPTFAFLHKDGTITKASGGKESVAQIVSMVERELDVDLG